MTPPALNQDAALPSAVERGDLLAAIGAIDANADNRSDVTVATDKWHGSVVALLQLAGGADHA